MHLSTPTLERLFTAITFAEAGEHETARQLAEPRRIVLALGAQAPGAATVIYARNACLRMGAALDILYAAALAGSALDAFTTALRAAGVASRHYAVDGDLGQAVNAHVHGDGSVVCVVADPTLKASWKGIDCPLVVPPA